MFVESSDWVGTYSQQLQIPDGVSELFRDMMKHSINVLHDKKEVSNCIYTNLSFSQTLSSIKNSPRKHKIPQDLDHMYSFKI